MFLEFFICEVKLTSFLVALLLINFIYIYNNENLQSILIHFKIDEFMKYNYSNCLKSKFIIFGLIVFLLNACNIIVNKISYGISSIAKTMLTRK